MRYVHCMCMEQRHTVRKFWLMPSGSIDNKDADDEMRWKLRWRHAHSNTVLGFRKTPRTSVHRSPLTFHLGTFDSPPALAGMVASRGQAHIMSLVFHCAQIAVASNDMGSL
jgi:hypothetical protein